MPRIHLFVSTENIFHPPALHEILRRHRPEIVGATVFPNPRHASLRNAVAQAVALDGIAAFPRMAGHWVRNRLDCARSSPPHFASVERLFAHHAVALERHGNPNDAACVEAVRARGTDVLLNLQPWYLRAPALAAPAIACLNAHTAALPKYRGVEPVVRALLAGDPQIGLSIHTMTDRIDEGRLLAQRLVPRAGSVFECYRATFQTLPDVVEDALAEIVRGGRGVEMPLGAPYFGALTQAETRAFRRLGLRYL